MARTLVIGDIHGALVALKQTLERAQVTVADHFIFLGDYVDGWSQSFDVVDFLLGFAKTHNCTFIKGNHDAWCEQWLTKNIVQERWFTNGGEASIKSYSNISSEKKLEHIAFFAALLNYYTDDKKRLFIHAGFAHTKGPRFDRFDADANWDKTLWETAISMDQNIPYDSAFYPKRLKLFREIFIGHTLTTDYGFSTPMQGTNVWNIDTGAGFKGKLTIMDADTKEFWQSDPVASLYPNENGRNGA